MKVSFLVLILFGQACSNQQGPMKRIELEGSYVPSKINQYFLADLPAWANFSVIGKCKRKSNIRFLNIKNLTQSYDLSYEEAIQMQAMLNYELQKLKDVSGRKLLGVRDEEKVFYDVLDRIKGGIYLFKTPKFKRVNFVWIDRILDKSQDELKVKRLLRSRVMDLGVPVIVSTCLSSGEIESWLERLQMASVVRHVVSAEFFSPFDHQSQLTMSFQLSFLKFFEQKQRLHFYSPVEFIPEEFQGSFLPHKI